MKYVFYHIFLYDRINEIILDQLKKLESSGLISESELFITVVDVFDGKYSIDSSNMDIINKYNSHMNYYDTKDVVVSGSKNDPSF